MTSVAAVPTGAERIFMDVHSMASCQNCTGRGDKRSFVGEEQSFCSGGKARLLFRDLRAKHSSSNLLFHLHLLCPPSRVPGALALLVINRSTISGLAAQSACGRLSLHPHSLTHNFHSKTLNLLSVLLVFPSFCLSVPKQSATGRVCSVDASGATESGWAARGCRFRPRTWGDKRRRLWEGGAKKLPHKRVLCLLPLCHASFPPPLPTPSHRPLC